MAIPLFTPATLKDMQWTDSALSLHSHTFDHHPKKWFLVPFFFYSFISDSRQHKQDNQNIIIKIKTQPEKGREEENFLNLPLSTIIRLNINITWRY